VEDSADKLSDICIGKEVAERVLGELANSSDSMDTKRDVLSPEAMELYFQYYFFARRMEMSYPVQAGKNGIGRDDSLLNMLSENSMAVASAAQIPVNYLRQSFKSAGEAFQAIDAPTQGVIVPFDDGKDVITDLCAAFALEAEFELLKRAQQYTVNVFPHVLRRLQQQNAVHEVQPGCGILYLDSRYYHAEFGLSETAVNLLEMQNV
jgi:CRISPR-associated endonuclease/helicase Cas3